MRHSESIRYQTIRQLAARLRRRECSAAELAGAALDGLQTVGASLNGLASALPESAMADAAQADQRLSTAHRPGRLCGIPYAVKDLFATRDSYTTWGSAFFRHQRFDYDADAIVRLRRKRTVLVAKLSMTELAGVGRPKFVTSSLQGPARNPWNPAHYAGGSSGGPAIAVGAGLVPFALGSETAGSIIGPSAFCGVTGLRPTHGLIPTNGTMQISPTLDKIGPIARSADDCGIILEALGRIGQFRRRPVSGSELAALRVAISPTEVDECDSTVQPTAAAAIEEFRRVVPRAIDRRLRRDLAYSWAIETIMAAEAGQEFGAHLRNPAFHLLNDTQLSNLRLSLGVTRVDLQEAMEVRDSIVTELNRIFQTVDLILSVTRTSTAPRLDALRPPRSDDTSSSILRSAANLAGIPGISFPCGLAEDGLPVALHLIGPRYSDQLLVAVAAAYQRQTHHHQLRPKLN